MLQLLDEINRNDFAYAPAAGERHGRLRVRLCARIVQLLLAGVR